MENTNKIETAFEKLNAKNVNAKTEKKGKFTYLSWAYAWQEIKLADANATFKIYENADGLPFFFNSALPQLGAFVKVGITFNGLELIETFPVLDNMNKSIVLDKLTSFTINTAIKRALAKASALHGLGLYIYAGEDLPEDTATTTQTADAVKTVDNTQTQSAKKVKVEAVGTTRETNAILKDLNFKNFKDENGNWKCVNHSVVLESLPKLVGVTYKIIQ